MDQLQIVQNLVEVYWMQYSGWNRGPGTPPAGVLILQERADHCAIGQQRFPWLYAREPEGGPGVDKVRLL